MNRQSYFHPSLSQRLSLKYWHKEFLAYWNSIVWTRQTKYIATKSCLHLSLVNIITYKSDPIPKSIDNKDFWNGNNFHGIDSCISLE